MTIENTIALRVENYKGVGHLQVVLEPGASVIGGKNGAGKSSVLDAVANAFGGKRLSPPKPVKEGAEGYECSVTLQKLGIVITRTGRIGEDGVLREKLTIEDAEGFKSPSPQALLNKLLNGSSIRPLAFAEISKAEQIKMLKEAQGIDWTELDAEYEGAFEARHDATVRAAAIAARVDAVGDIEDPGPAMDVASIQKEIGRATKHNAEIGAQQQAAKEREKTLAVQGVQLRQAQASVARIEKEIARLEREAVRGITGELVDVEALRGNYARAQTHNRAVEAWKQRADMLKQQEAEQAEIDKQDGIVQRIRQTKQEQLAGAQLPVPGLTFDEKGVYFKGVPFEQASQSEQLGVSVRLGLALHPEVPIVLVREGSLFDIDHLRELDVLAKEHKAFVFVEVVMEEPQEDVKVFMVAGTGEVQDGKSK